ncbi:MAG: glycine cleavage system protein H [Acidobacteriia bacterium]|nr:glycine cleavage system protein H [Terriglobia bacterium]
MRGDILKITVDKFTFLVPAGLFYSEAGVWVKLEGNRARLGLTDFAQQSSGDAAFANVKPVGTSLQLGDEFADIETVKVNVSFPSPLRGTIAEVNSSLAEAAEVLNQDPYGTGWVAVVELSDWESDRVHLLDAQAYLALVKNQAEAEMKK